jgi:hypothetical protein
MPVTTCTDAALRGTLEDQHDEVVRRVRHQQPLVQAAGGTGTVLPPSVGTGTDDVRAVDDEGAAHGGRAYLRNFEKSLGRSRFAAAVS